jgi:hypothetical protein
MLIIPLLNRPKPSGLVTATYAGGEGASWQFDQPELLNWQKGVAGCREKGREMVFIRLEQPARKKTADFRIF